MIEDIKKAIKIIESLCENYETKTHNVIHQNYPCWIFNSLTTVELTLKDTLKEVKKHDR